MDNMANPANTASDATSQPARRHWLSVLAKAPAAALEEAWQALDDKPDYSPLRPAQTGLVMVRGRMGGSGDAFNLGEMTVSRCSVRTADGRIGHGYAAGRDKRHAELVALFDAVLQQPEAASRLHSGLIEPLAAEQRRRHGEKARESAATKVEFFTMVRGED